MNEEQLIAAPITETLPYRGKIDTFKLNEIIKSLEESVLRAIIRGSKLQEKINMMILAINSSYMSFAKSNQIYTSYPSTSDITSSTSYVGVAFATAFGGVDGVKQDKSAGIVTLDWSDNNKLSKIPIYEGIVSPNIKIYVDDILRSNEDAVYNILDKDLTNFWIESTTAGVHSLELVLPPSLSNTFNYIEVLPFPIFGIEITSIQYTDLVGNSKTIYPTSENSFYSNGGPLVFHLSPREFNNAIKINFNVIDGIEVMGFSLIDICSIDYQNNTNTVYLKFENIPQTDTQGNEVTDITLVSIDTDFYVDGILNTSYDNFITELSLVPSVGSSDTVGLKRIKGYQTIPETTVTLGTSGSEKTLYLKVVMNEVNTTTPVFRGAKLNFTYGSIV